MKQQGTGLLPSGRVDLTGDEDPTDEDGDTGMGDSTGVSTSLGGEISSGGKKSQKLNIGNSIGDGGKIVGEAIGIKPDELFEDLEVFPGEAGK
ncbi:hypothetical protein Tco_0972089 [Tanacetum coccineum]